ncbi:MAG TPA: restriction endonuclease subunit S, partial [Thermoanaerobaculia bacterium]
LVGSDVPPAILAAPLLLIRPTNVLPGFLYWFINSAPAQAQLASMAAGTSVQMISADSLRTLEVPMPPVAAQERIAEIARLIRREEELMTEIATRRKRLATHMLINYAFHGTTGVPQ